MPGEYPSLDLLQCLGKLLRRSVESIITQPIDRPAKAHHLRACQSCIRLGARDPNGSSVHLPPGVGLAGGVPLGYTTKCLPARMQASGGLGRVRLAVPTVAALICTQPPALRHSSDSIQAHVVSSGSNSVRTTPGLFALKSFSAQRISHRDTSQGY